MVYSIQPQREVRILSGYHRKRANTVNGKDEMTWLTSVAWYNDQQACNRRDALTKVYQSTIV